MRKVITALFISSLILITPLTAYAATETFAERCQRRQREAQEKFVSDLEKEGNLTQEAIDAFGLKGKQPQKKSSKTTSSGNTVTSNAGTGKGWIYSTDELHVIGLPEGEDGYTLSGWYGDPE